MGVGDVCLHGWQRAGGNCASPFDSLTRRSAGVSHIFVATSIKATVSSAGYAGAKPPPSR